MKDAEYVFIELNEMHEILQLNFIWLNRKKKNIQTATLALDQMATPSPEKDQRVRGNEDVSGRCESMSFSMSEVCAGQA